MLTFPVCLFGGGGVNAVDFNGSNQRITFSNATLSNSSTGIFSVWFRQDIADAAAHTIWDDGSTSAYIQLRYASNKGLDFNLRSLAGDIYRYRSANDSYNSTGVWHHFLASWDVNAAAGARTVHIYEDDSDNTGSALSITDTGSAYSVYYNGGGGSSALGVTGTSDFWNGCLAEVYFAPNQYLDLTVEANRRKFRSPTGSPVSLGADGSTPTGVAPYLYLQNPASTFNINSGSGPDGTVVNGPLSGCSTIPKP